MRLFFFVLISFNLIYSQTNIDFEANGYGADLTWTADQEDSSFEIVDNPIASDEVNSSSKVGKLTCASTTPEWGLVYTDINTTFTSSNAIVTMDVYKTRAVNVAIKFEIPPNASYREVTATSSGAAGWETLTFDFSDQIDNGVTYTRIVIIPDFASRDETTISYFDNIEFSSDGSESSDPSDATLQNIYVDGAALTGFSSDQFSYTYTLDVGDTTVPTITATASNPSAVVSISPASSVSGTTTVTVTSEDGTTTQDYTIAFQGSYWDLKWSDEFDYDGAVDPAKWHHQTYPANGGQGWFNNEQQHYTDRIDNSYVSDGTLKIKAIKENYTYPQTGSTQEYTSARLNSKYAFKYGKMEVRAKLPSELGTWPAIWTLGQNITERGAYWQTQGLGTTSWPACGEIDIMEQKGTSASEKLKTSGAFHFPPEGGYHTYTTAEISVDDTDGTWHDYSMIWTADSISLMVDGVEFHNTTNNGTVDMSYFQDNHFILLNIAMGGELGGAIPFDFSSAIMEIDYVRVYQKESLSIPKVNSRPKLVVYPNPANNRIAVSSEYNIESLSIYAISGQRVLHQKPQQHEVFVNLDLPAGIYLIQAHVAGEKLHQKLIIK